MSLPSVRNFMNCHCVVSRVFEVFDALCVWSDDVLMLTHVSVSFAVSALGNGDCDSDVDCEGNLVCGHNNCNKIGTARFSHCIG